MLCDEEWDGDKEVDVAVDEVTVDDDDTVEVGNELKEGILGDTEAQEEVNEDVCISG